jgi:hypothetical protein
MKVVFVYEVLSLFFENVAGALTKVYVKKDGREKGVEGEGLKGLGHQLDTFFKAYKI